MQDPLPPLATADRGSGRWITGEGHLRDKEILRFPISLLRIQSTV